MGSPVVEEPSMALDELLGLFRSLWHWSTTHRFLLLSAVFPLLVRSIPEILAGPWPLGFDTVWIYAPFVKDVETKGFVPSIGGILDVQAAPLVYVLLGLVAGTTNAPPFAITKAAAPVLYGFLGLALYVFARRGLGWNKERSLLLVGLSTLYFVPLRFSWDMYKNTLGLGFFLLALSDLGRVSGRRTTFLLLVFSMLSILASEFTTALLTGTALVLVGWTRITERRLDFVAATVAMVGTVALLFYGHVMSAPAPVVSPLAPLPSQPGFLWNYVGSDEDVYVYPRFADVYVSVFSLASLILAPILPLGFVGRFRDKRLSASLLFLGFTVSSVLISPFAALPAWHRWLFMLVFPVLVFATAGILRLNRKAAVVVVASLFLLGATFVAMPENLALPYYTFPATLRYIPPNLMRNTVDLQDSPDVVAVARWANDQNFPRSVLVADIWFCGWARLYIDRIPVYGFSDPIQVDQGNFSAFEHVFTIYWSTGQDGYQASRTPSGATEIFTAGRIGFYEIRSS